MLYSKYSIYIRVKTLNENYRFDHPKFDGNHFFGLKCFLLCIKKIYITSDRSFKSYVLNAYIKYEEKRKSV